MTDEVGLTLHNTAEAIDNREKQWEEGVDARESGYHLARKIQRASKLVRNGTILGGLCVVIAADEIYAKLPFETHNVAAYDKSVVGLVALAGATHLSHWISRFTGDVKAYEARKVARELSAPPPFWAAESKRQGELYDEDRRPTTYWQ